MESVMVFMSVSPRIRLVVEAEFRHFFSFFIAVTLLNK